MRNLIGAILAALGFLCSAGAVSAQGFNPPAAGTYCNTGSGWTPCGNFSATIAGFAPGAAYANLTSTASSARAALPSGTVVAAFNTGTTAVSCALGSGSVTAVANENVIQASSWFAFTVGANVDLACINQAGDGASNVVVMSGGTGLPTGSGGGGGGSSANASVGSTGSAVPSSATYVGITSGGNLTGWNGAVTNAGTFAVQATLQASGSTAIGKVDPNTIATWGLMSGTVPGTAPTNTMLAGAIYNSSPPGPTTGQTLPLQVDSAGNLNVNIKAGAGSGGTALADGATFTEATTSFTPVGGEYVSGGGANCTTGKGCTVQMTVDRMAYVNIGKIGGAATGTAGSAGTGVVTVQGIASMTPVLTNPGTAATWGLVAVAGAAAPTNGLVGGAVYNASPITVTTTQAAALQSDVNGYLNVDVKTATGLAQGSTTSGQTGSLVMGAASTNAPTATASDTWPLSISPASGGVRIDLKDTASNTNSFLVNVASGGIASGAIASGAIASGAFASGSFVNATAGDPCMFQAKTNVPISTASGTVAVVTGVSAKKIYVCSLSLVAAGAISVSLAEGSSSTCGTSAQAAVLGVATNGTAANGIALAANGGLTLGNGGGTVAATATNANYLCLFQSGTTQIAGNLTYVQQ